VTPSRVSAISVTTVAATAARVSSHQKDFSSDRTFCADGWRKSKVCQLVLVAASQFPNNVGQVLICLLSVMLADYARLYNNVPLMTCALSTPRAASALEDRYNRRWWYTCSMTLLQSAAAGPLPAAMLSLLETRALYKSAKRGSRRFRRPPPLL
jgi:hypothetical protein